jgi:hypothetical protein
MRCAFGGPLSSPLFNGPKLVGRFGKLLTILGKATRANSSGFRQPPVDSKIREVLRLTHELGLSVRQVRNATGVGKTAVCE